MLLSLIKEQPSRTNAQRRQRRQESRLGRRNRAARRGSPRDQCVKAKRKPSASPLVPEARPPFLSVRSHLEGTVVNRAARGEFPAARFSWRAGHQPHPTPPVPSTPEIHQRFIGLLSLVV